MYWGNYGWGWGMGFGWIFMILFWILVIMGIIYLVKAIAGMEKKAPTEETPLDILKKRYARGDIAKEEYERIKDDILKQ